MEYEKLKQMSTSKNGELMIYIKMKMKYSPTRPSRAWAPQRECLLCHNQNNKLLNDPIPRIASH